MTLLDSIKKSPRKIATDLATPEECAEVIAAVVNRQITAYAASEAVGGKSQGASGVLWPMLLRLVASGHLRVDLVRKDDAK